MKWIEEGDQIIQLVDSYDQVNILFSIVDSGAMSHFWKSENDLYVRYLSSPKSILSVNKNEKANLLINKVGDLFTKDLKGNKLILRDIMISSDINFNLLSTNKLMVENKWVKFCNDRVFYKII